MNMADVVSSNSPSLTKLEEKISSLEAKIAALEKRHNDLHEKASTLTENPAGKSSEVAATEVCSDKANRFLFFCHFLSLNLN